VKRFRGGLVFEAHRRLYHSTLGLRVIKKKEKPYTPNPESIQPTTLNSRPGVGGTVGEPRLLASRARPPPPHHPHPQSPHPHRCATQRRASLSRANGAWLVVDHFLRGRRLMKKKKSRDVARLTCVTRPELNRVVKSSATSSLLLSSLELSETKVKQP